MNAGHTAGPLKRQDWLVVALLFLFLSSIYYASASGITSSNDGSHYALLRALVQNRSFALGQFDDYAEGNDIAVAEDGRLFSDRPPGTALTGALFYLAGGALPQPPAELPSRHDAGNPRLATVLFLPTWAGAGTVAILYLLMRGLGIPAAAALTAGVMFGLGTAHWKYSSVLFSHALSAFLVVASLAVAVAIGRGRRHGWPSYLLLGGLLGAAVLVEYSNALLVTILTGYVTWYGRPYNLRRFTRTLLPLLLGGLVAAAFLAFYNQVNFGTPWRLSYSYAINYPWAGSFGTTFNYPLLEGLRGLLVWGTGDGWCDPTCMNQGLLLLSPVLLLTLPGWYFFFRQARREALLTATLFLVYLLLFARHRTYHGFTADGRYLVPYLGLLAVPLGFAMARIMGLGKQPLVQAALLFVAYGLFFLSFGNMVVHIGTSYNYTLDLSQLGEPLLRPENWGTVSRAIFPNTANLPLLWLGEIALAALIVASLWLWRSWRRRRGREG